MSKPDTAAFASLERIFHEPARLAIMSVLCAAGDEGCTFNALKSDCQLTDGNLNRHLNVLEESGVIRVRKAFVEAKPRTTVHLSKAGVERFQEYLDALNEVLLVARRALPVEKPAGALPGLGAALKGRP